MSITTIEKEVSSKLRVLTVIDPHFADKSPGSRVDDYFQASINKLKQISVIAKKKKVDLVLLTGDLFSEKRKEKNSHKLTSTLIETFLEYPCPVASILGNHDLIYNRFEYWPSQPVSTLIKSRAISLLDTEDYLFKFKKTGKTVRVCGTSFNEDLNIEYLKEPKKGEDFMIRVTHSAIEPKAGTYVYGERIWAYNELVEFPPDIFVLGHIHNDHGITELDGKLFLQHGSLMRSSSHDYNLERDIKIGYIEIDQDLKVKSDQIKLDIAPSKDVFCLEKKRKIEQELKEMKSFFDQLQKTSEEVTKKGIDVTIKDLAGSFEGRDSGTIEKLVDHYLELVRD